MVPPSREASREAMPRSQLERMLRMEELKGTCNIPKPHTIRVQIIRLSDLPFALPQIRRETRGQVWVTLVAFAF